MATYIARLDVHNLHRRLDISIDFDRNINVLFGKNGTGKTTLLHILANILNGSLDRFAYLEFDHIAMLTSDERRIELHRKDAQGGESIIQVVLDGRELSSINANAVRERFREQSLRERTDIDFADEVQRSKQMRENLGTRPAAYFPAFRTMIEAWKSVSLDDYGIFHPIEPLARYVSPRSRATVTSFARGLFGNFVPMLNYPSLLDIERDLSREIESSSFAVARESQDILTGAFVDALRAVLSVDSLTPSGQRVVAAQDATNVAQDIEKLLQELDQSPAVTGDSDELVEQDDVYVQLRGILSGTQIDHVSDTSAAASVLSLLQQALKRQNEVRRQTYAAVDQYVASVNEFLEQKHLEVSRRQRQNARDTRRVSIRLADDAKANLQSLSSGERQIVSMLYAASPALSSSSSVMGNSDVVLIDEPELSLHIDWQRDLLPKMERQVGKRQIIVCTHSPEIGADYENKYREVLYRWAGDGALRNGHAHRIAERMEGEDVELDESEL